MIHINEMIIQSLDAQSIQILINEIEYLIKDNKLDLSQASDNIKALFLFS